MGEDQGVVPASVREACKRILERGAEKVGRLVREEPGLWPFYTEGGRWIRQGETWTEWCQGFLPGQLWILHDFTGDPFFREEAIRRCRALEGRASDPSIHDHGFLFRSSWLRWFEHDGDPALERPVLEAGRALAGRARGGGRYLCSFLGDHSLFIDIMMNVGIVLYAAGRTGDEGLRETGLEHCRTTRRYLLRGDGSSLHEGIFDPKTGEFLRPSTQQGWRPDSCWARGQAWALHGFADVYRLTGEDGMLAAARAAAEYYLAQVLGNRVVPPNDFDEPGRVPPDSSAAAIAAGGFLLLGRLLDKEAGDEAARYREEAWRILEGLASPEWLAPAGPLPEGILLHGIYHRRRNLGVDACTAWGDYFLLDAAWRVLAGEERGSS